MPSEPTPKQRTIGRLYNWKFESAYEAASRARVGVSALSALGELAADYGNVGWFDGRMADALRERVDKAFRLITKTGEGPVSEEEWEEAQK